MSDDSQIKWGKDVDQALRTAKQQQRPVLVDFTAAPS